MQPTAARGDGGDAVTHSATLAANERIAARIASGAPVVHLAFGEAGLPVHPRLAEVLAQAAHRTGYPPVAGDPAAREAVAGYFTRRDLETDPSQTILAPGSKALLYALLAALPGDVFLPRPSWVSYAAQAALVGRRTHFVPTPDHTGGVPDPLRLREAIGAARRDGGRPGVLILTRPDNPTGAVAPDSDVAAVCEVAAEHDLQIVSDEIYGDLTHPRDDDDRYPLSPAVLLPERTVVTTGLSKRLALGGWRIGVARVPAGPRGAELMSRLVAIGSEVWSAMPGPMQEVTTYAFGEPEEMRDHVARSRRLHAAVSRAMWRTWTGAGAACRQPSGGFYCYPDLTAHAGVLGEAGVRTSADLADLMLERYDIGVLPGSAFGDDPARLAVRVATSLLYGDTPERRAEALASADPPRLPWIASALDRVDDALADLLRNRS